MFGAPRPPVAMPWCRANANLQKLIPAGIWIDKYWIYDILIINYINMTIVQG